MWWFSPPADRPAHALVPHANAWIEAIPIHALPASHWPAPGPASAHCALLPGLLVATANHGSRLWRYSRGCLNPYYFLFHLSYSCFIFHLSCARIGQQLRSKQAWMRRATASHPSIASLFSRAFALQPPSPFCMCRPILWTFESCRCRSDSRGCHLLHPKPDALTRLPPPPRPADSFRNQNLSRIERTWMCTGAIMRDLSQGMISA